MTIRTTVDLGPRDYAAPEAFCRLHGRTKADVIRDALQTSAHLVERGALREGLLLRGPQGDQIRVLVLGWLGAGPEVPPETSHGHPEGKQS